MRAILNLGHQDAKNFVIPLDDGSNPGCLALQKICVSREFGGGVTRAL